MPEIDEETVEIACQAWWCAFLENLSSLGLIPIGWKPWEFEAETCKKAHRLYMRAALQAIQSKGGINEQEEYVSETRQGTR